MAAEPPSLANSQFCSLGSFNYNKILSDDYCHKKLETIKFKAASQEGTTFNLKFNKQFKKDSTKLFLTDEYKFGFPYQRYYLQTRVKRTGDVKIHLDGGNIELAKKKFNLFSNVKTTLIFAHYTARFGFNHFGERCESNWRIETNDKGNHDFANRTVLNHGKWRYGIVSILGLNDHVIKKYDSFVEYRNKDFELHLSHLSPKVHEGLSLGKVVFGALYRLNDKTNLALQVRRNFSFPDLKAVFGIQKNFEKGTVRAKCDHKLKISTVGKYKVNSRLTLSGGAQFDLSKGSKFIDFSKKLPLPLGIGIDIEA